MKAGTFHFVRKVNGHRYKSQVTVANLQVQLYRMELEEVEKVMNELKTQGKKEAKIFLEIDPEELEDILEPVLHKLRNERYREENGC